MEFAKYIRFYQKSRKAKIKNKFYKTNIKYYSITLAISSKNKFSKLAR